MPETPEQKARCAIDADLMVAGWLVQDRADLDLTAGRLHRRARVPDEVRLRFRPGLRQAILRHAFTGQLVPQDANDEPASELLKRIASEREARARDTGRKPDGARNRRRRASRGGRLPA